MLPNSENRIRAHVGGDQSNDSFLKNFRGNNPQLVPVKWDGRGMFCQQLWHIAFLNHREHSSGLEPECCFKSPLTSCIKDHSELWQDRDTLDLVHIAHPYCDGTDADFSKGVEFLVGRGLNCAMYDASWYYPGHSKLVVVARPRTLERINCDNVLNLYNSNEEADTERVVAIQKAVEQIDADRWFADAKAEESRGDYRRASLLFVDLAHTERTGRFHRQAVKCLREAARLLRDHYNEAILSVGTRSFLTRAEVRKIFRFAGVEVPEWLERAWRNGRRRDGWGYRREMDANSTGPIEYYRCVVCEEWMEEGERVRNDALGYIHSDRACLVKASESPSVFSVT